MMEDAFNAARSTNLSIDGFDVVYKYRNFSEYKQKQQSK